MQCLMLRYSHLKLGLDQLSKSCESFIQSYSPFSLGNYGCFVTICLIKQLIISSSNVLGRRAGYFISNISESNDVAPK